MIVLTERAADTNGDATAKRIRVEDTMGILRVMPETHDRFGFSLLYFEYTTSQSYFLIKYFDHCVNLSALKLGYCFLL